MSSVLYVCTGNICRSPMAEHLLRAGLGGGSPIDVGSAGTHGLEGDPMELYAREVLAERGIDGSAFRARALTAEQVAEADLVLTATREHRLAVAALQPGAAGRTFTILEMARLLPQVDRAAVAGDPAALARAALALRSPARRAKDDDLPDPYRGPRRGFAACARTLEAATAPLVPVLTPA